MPSFFVADTPAVPFTVALTRDGEPVDLGDYDTAQVIVDGTSLATTLNGDGVVAEWPSVSLFTEEGLVPVQVVLEGTAGIRETFDAEPILVQALDGWHTLSSARRALPGTALSDEDLFTYLYVAKIACKAYAPALPEGDPVPLRYRQAQLLQARNVLNAARANPDSGDFGQDTFALSTRPLDWAVKALLRPQTALPKVG